MKRMNNFYKLSVSVLTLALFGCGGGSSSDSVIPMPPVVPTPPAVEAQTVAALQGIWQSPAGAASTISAIVLPDGTSWSVVTTGTTTSLLKTSFVAQSSGFAGTGRAYTLGTITVDDITATASVVEKTSMSGMVSRAGQTESYALSYQSRYDTPTTLADLAGTWSATLGPGVVTWVIAGDGVLTGSRTTGCTYSGSLSLRSEAKSVVDVAITETCSGTDTLLSGVAALGVGKTNLGMVMTTPNDAAGVAVSLARKQFHFGTCWRSYPFAVGSGRAAEIC